MGMRPDVCTAYEVLGDKSRRKKYDRMLEFGIKDYDEALLYEVDRRYTTCALREGGEGEGREAE